MRAKPTYYERMFREKLTRWGIAFLDQWIIGPWIADFYLPAYRTVIEIDGKHHSWPKTLQRDLRRTAWFKNRQFNVVRIPNPEVAELTKEDLIALCKTHEEEKLEILDRSFHNEYLATL